MKLQRGATSTILIFSSLLVIVLGTTIGMTSDLSQLRNRFTTAQEASGCPYRAEAVVMKQESNTPLLVSENGTTDNYGVANDFNLRTNPGKATGTFGRYDRNNDQIYDYFDDKPASYSGTDFNIISKYVYHNDHLVFAPSEDKGVVDGMAISVTVFGLDETKWKITGQFCDQLKGSTKGCPTDLDKTSTSTTMSNLRPTCGTNIRYGWMVAPQDGVVVEPTGGEETGKCELEKEGCAVKDPQLSFLSRQRFRVTWENPTTIDDNSSCPSLKLGESAVRVDIHQGGINDDVVCSKTVGYDKDDTATNCPSVNKFIKGQKYIAVVRTSMPDSSCSSPTTTVEATYDGAVTAPTEGVEPTDGPVDGDPSDEFNTFALNIWNTDKFVSPGDDHLCWSVGNNQGLDNIKSNSFSDYECKGQVARNSSDKVEKLSACYKNKTGTDARVGWQVHRCEDNDNNCVQENTGSNGDRVEEAGDLRKLNNNKWYKCTWDVKNLKNPNTITLDECQVNLDSCSFSDDGGKSPKPTDPQDPNPTSPPSKPDPTRTPPAPPDGTSYCSQETIANRIREYLKERGESLPENVINIRASVMQCVCNRESGSPFGLNASCLKGSTADYSIGIYQINVWPGPQHCPSGVNGLIKYTSGARQCGWSPASSADPNNWKIPSDKSNPIHACIKYFEEPENNHKEMINKSGGVSCLGPWLPDKKYIDKCDLRGWANRDGEVMRLFRKPNCSANYL